MREFNLKINFSECVLEICHFFQKAKTKLTSIVAPLIDGVVIVVGGSGLLIVGVVVLAKDGTEENEEREKRLSDTHPKSFSLFFYELVFVREGDRGGNLQRP